MTEALLEVYRSMVLLVRLDGVKEVNFDLPLEDRPGGFFFKIGENLTLLGQSLITIKIVSKLEMSTQTQTQQMPE